MENKKRAQDFLARYRVYAEKLSYIVEQMFYIDRLLITAKDQLGETDPRYIALLKERKEMAFHRAAVAGWKEVIEETVRRLPQPERRILERFYLSDSSRYAAEDLMESLEFEKTHIYRLRDRALCRLGEMLDGEQNDVIFTVLGVGGGVVTSKGKHPYQKTGQDDAEEHDR